MKLILPSAKYQASYCAYIDELGDEERYPFPLDFDYQDFGAMLARIEAFRPSRRRQGLGNRLLSLTLEKAQQMGIEEVHIHCEKNNPASAAMIIANGGKLHSEITEATHESVIQRYRIPLAQSPLSN